MNFPSMHIDTISTALPILCFKRSQVKGDVCLSLKVVLILADSAGPDEMQHYAPFHLGLPCLPKYPFIFVCLI